MGKERLGEFVYHLSRPTLWYACSHVPDAAIKRSPSELATGGKTAHLPYKEMDKKQKVFIENKYLPKKAKIKQPRNLTKSAIAEIFDHITKRQEKYGPSEAFKFKNIKMKGDIQPTQYPDPKSVAAHPPTADRNADADADTAICEDDTIDKAGNMTGTVDHVFLCVEDHS